MQTVTLSPYRRAFLISTKNRNYLSLWDYGKPQLYGRAVVSVQTVRLVCPHKPGLESSTSTKTE